jgi:superfamily II DNA or RNA helicase/HKD family nuclease
MAAVDRVRAEIRARFRADAFNVGFNDGAAAGQTVFHLHVHVIPRVSGDMEDPRGGVRYVVPGRARYWEAKPSLPSGSVLKPPPARALVSGGTDDPLLPLLKWHFSQAKAADIAVAFAMRSGMDLLQAEMQDLLDRKGRLRLVTGDYLDATDPDALVRLLDLQGDVACRVFETRGRSYDADWATSFHPKSYLFHHDDGTAAAFVGSSNLSETALSGGVEWNYRIMSADAPTGISEVKSAFDTLFSHEATRPLTADWVDAYRSRRRQPVLARGLGVKEDAPAVAATPHAIQQNALAALAASRAAGEVAGLVVLATGLGKTWLAAFDTRPFRRVLFVAHRDEILQQALNTFRRVRPDSRLGLFNGSEKDTEADVLFASVLTIGRSEHLLKFRPDHFDYIVVDEFHHAEAATYRRLIAHFRPKYLLGLTATPERSDGANLLDLCGGNLVHECSIADGIAAALLSPFRYFGVPDTIDYSNIPWRSRRFDEDVLTREAATNARAGNALEQLQKRGGDRTIAFCVSQRHADFMADFLLRSGVPSAAVHSGSSSAPRVASLEALKRGELKVICAVDMFNEGVDVPQIDTVLMLRPTESRILWLQQIGRGLRKVEGKVLTVIDYIGNHRSFMLKAMALGGLMSDAPDERVMLDVIADGALELPPGCEVTYETEAIDMLRRLVPQASSGEVLLEARYRSFQEQNGVRPRAVELFREGFRPGVVQKRDGSWLRFVERMGGLDGNAVEALKAHAAFLTDMEKTSMTRSYKMLVMRAILDSGRFPGPIALVDLASDIAAMATRDRRLADDLGLTPIDAKRVKALLKKNAITYLSGEGSGAHFRFKDNALTVPLLIGSPHLDAVADMLREIVDWRLEAYLAGRRVKGDAGGMMSVIQSSGRPILMLSAGARERFPRGWTEVRVDDEVLLLNFVKIAVNVARRLEGSENVLAQVLRHWFGAEAGMPGTGFSVELLRDEEGWRLVQR